MGGTTFLLNSSQLQSLGSSCQCFCKIFIRTESNIQTFISIISLALSSTTGCPINLGQIIIIITESSPVFCDLTQMSDTVWLHYSDNWPLLEQFHQFYSTAQAKKCNFLIFCNFWTLKIKISCFNWSSLTQTFKITSYTENLFLLFMP